MYDQTKIIFYTDGEIYPCERRYINTRTDLSVSRGPLPGDPGIMEVENMGILVEGTSNRSSMPITYDYVKATFDRLQLMSNNQFIPFNRYAFPILPRQVEVHLPPSQLDKLCNLACSHCQGKFFKKVIANISEGLTEFINIFGSEVESFVISGNYTEPTLNHNLLDYILSIKRAGSNFALYTNGTLLMHLEKENQFLTKIHEVSDKGDYFSVSVDAGSPASFAQTKKPRQWFLDARAIKGHSRQPESIYDDIWRGVSFLRGKRNSDGKGPMLRISYLLNAKNSSEEELDHAVQSATDAGVDSIRFAIPYLPYGVKMEICKKHNRTYAADFYNRVMPKILPFLTVSEGLPPEAQQQFQSIRAKKKLAPGFGPAVIFMAPVMYDLERINFWHCFAGYREVVIGTDGGFYRCPASTNARFAGSHRLGTLTEFQQSSDPRQYFYDVLSANQNSCFNPLQECFPEGARCNRADLNWNAWAGQHFFGLQNHKKHRGYK